MDMNKLLKKNVACFYCFCIDFNFQACENLAWIQQWEIKVLIPKNVRFVHVAMEVTFQVDEWDEYKNDGDHLAACNSLRDNFIMNAKQGNEEGFNFYILVCTQTSFMVEQAFTCAHGGKNSLQVS
jgi:hypothetical protein